MLAVALVPAHAQQDTGETRTIDTIRVTGSNIKRAEIESALPVQIITREDIDRSGVISVAALMNQVSANLVADTDAVFVGNAQGRLISGANLRGLGDGSTLVLLNGRRVSNYAANGGTVNLNFIPLTAIDRVEILKDGASAIYGADAMAGVVNFILRTEYSGAEVSAYGTATEHGGGNQAQATVAGGYGDLALDRFNVFVTAAYQKNYALPARDRAYSATSLRPDEGLINLNTETFPANIRTSTGALVNPAFAAGCAPPISLPVPGTQRCGHDSNAVMNILPPVERTYVLAGGTWQPIQTVQLFAQYLYAHNDQTWIRNQVPSSRNFNSGGQPLLYPANGPFYPTAFAAAHGIAGALDLFYRALPLGPITDDVTADAQHAVAGVEGLAAGWGYNLAVIYSENRQRYVGVSGRASQQRLIAAMATGLINPFGASGPEGDALLAGTEASGEVFHTRAASSAFEAKATRDIYALPAGPLAVALGGEARREQLAIDYNPEQTSGDILGSTISPSASGGRSAEAAFIELNVPMAKGLEAQLAARVDHYSDFGSTTNPKIAVRWQPMAPLLLRSSYGTGFRAPTLIDLSTPTSTGTTRVRSDPARCPHTGLVSDCSAMFVVNSGGNPDLDAEKSHQFNFGVVWEPVPDASGSLDYWKIDKSRTIGRLTDDQVFNLFLSTNIIRGPPDPAFPSLPGPIVYISENTQNLGKRRTSGVDVDLAFHGSPTSIGRFGFSLNGTYVAEWQEQLDGIHFVTAVGRNVVGAIPRWRHYATLRWDYGPWSATLAQNSQSGYTDANLNAHEKERRVGAYDIWNAQVAYGGLKDTTLTLGIVNLFDRAPPFSNQSAAGQVMFDPGYADPRGRTFYARIALAFK